MKLTNTFNSNLSILFLSAVLIFSCSEDDAAEGTDKMLFDMAVQNNVFTWYKFSDKLLPKSSGSAHPQAFLRTRYNLIANMNLDAGKVKNTGYFLPGSLIVKELYSANNVLERYAILYKNPASSDADANGWVWGYINKDGSVAESSSKKGSSCIGCHSQSGNLDYTLMNKFFP